MKTSAKVVVAVLLATGVIYLLFTVVFPWVDRTFVTDPVIEARQGGVVAHVWRPTAVELEQAL